MLAIAIKAIAMTLRVVLLLQGVRTRTLRRYPLFYSYLGYGLVSGLITSWIQAFDKPRYLAAYWYATFLSSAFVFAILWELYGLIFRDYPGSARMARFLVTFALACCFISGVLYLAIWSPGNLGPLMELEKTIRLVQVILVALSWALVLYYEIPLGQNVTGLVFGFGFYAMASFLLLLVRPWIPIELFELWRHSQPVAFVLTEVTWLVALKEYAPAPAAAVPRSEELEFPFMAPDSRLALAKARASLGRALQP